MINKIFKVFSVCILCFLHGNLYSQTEGSAFNQTGRGGTATTFATDYQSIGINPANLGFNTDHSIALGILEGGFSFYSEALLKDDVRAIIFNNADTVVSPADQAALAEAFLENGVTFNADVRVLGLSFKVSDHAAFALSFDGATSYHSKLGSNASSLIYEGYDFDAYIDTIVITPTDTFGVAYEPLSLAEIMDGTEFKFNVRSNINLSFGTRLFENDNFQIFGGIGLKYVMGFAYLDLESDGNTINGTSALGLGILDLNAFDTPSEIITETFKPVGSGFGLDLGASIKIGEKITLGVSVIDLGKMTYTANVLQLNDVVLDTIRFSGVTTTDPVQLLNQILDNQNVIAYSGLKEFDVALPATLRLGGGLKISDQLNLGADLVMPLNDVAGAYSNALFSLGGELKLLDILKVSSGIAFGGGYEFNLNGGFGLDFKVWEIGIATRDLLTLFGQERPTVSLAAGFLRFKI